jgi:signal transduction histidine kinase
MERPSSRAVRPFSPARPLGLAMVAVVVSFTAALVLSHYAARAIDADVAGIATDAAPSVSHLALARTQLRRLVTYASLFVAWRSEGAATSLANIETARQRLAAEWATYRALPAFPGESEMAARAEQEIRPLMTLVGRILKQIGDGDLAGARALWHEEMLPAVERLDTSLEQLIEHNAAYARVRAQEISRVRHSAAMTGLCLGVMSVLLAGAATVLAFETLRRHERAVAERNLLVKARADELEQFASRVAHDIKSPLGAVGLALQVARRSSDRQRIDSVTGRALNSLQRVQQIVDGLLDFAKAGARPEPGTFTPLCRLVDEVVDELRPLAEQRGVAVTVRAAQDCRVACTPGAAASVVSNLIRNAIKFSGDNAERRVEVRVLDRGRFARLEVEDNGPGVPSALQEVIFEPYVRAPGVSEPGVGLGLATVKRLAEAHGGGVGVWSTLGQGSCFWVELPKVAPADGGTGTAVQGSGTSSAAPAG